MEVKIINKNNEELFLVSGKEIDVVYNGVYEEGTKICISSTPISWVDS